MNENKTVEKKKQTLQDIDIPKYIQIASVIFITLSVIAAVLNLVTDILTQGRATLNQLAYLEKVVSNVTLGLVFWGTGQVFAKLLGKASTT